VLGAADTFRAAAADQLQTWGERVGVPTVRSEREGADPAAVALDAVKGGTELEADVVIVGAAGRLHNKVGLMDELGKVKRVIEKQSPIDEVLLVLDATTGQNGLRQAEVFAEVVNVTGIVLTKLDGTAKGGIVVAVQRKLGVPVKLVGLGEGPDDLAPFDPEAFVGALLSSPWRRGGPRTPCTAGATRALWCGWATRCVVLEATGRRPATYFWHTWSPSGSAMSRPSSASMTGAARFCRWSAVRWACLIPAVCFRRGFAQRRPVGRSGTGCAGSTMPSGASSRTLRCRGDCMPAVHCARGKYSSTTTRRPTTRSGDPMAA